MKKNSILLSILFFAVTGLHAQVGNSKQEDVQSVQKRTLIVVLEEVNDKLVEKLEGETQAQYKRDVEDYNKAIKAAVQRCWKFNEHIEYKTRAETAVLTKAKNKQYAYLEYNKFTVNCANANAYKSTYQFKQGAKEITAVGGDYLSTQINIRLCDDNPLSPPVFGVHLPNPYPNEADLVYGLKAMQLQFGYKLAALKDIPIDKMFKENAKALVNLTLLVNEKYTDLKIDEVKKAYPYPVELVKKDKIDEIILSGDEKYAFATVIPYSGSSFNFLILSAKDCTVLGNTNDTQTTGVKLGGLVGGMAGDVLDITDYMTRMKIKKDHFKLFAKQVK